MQQDLAISEQMMFSTVKLNTSTGSGTGFFFVFSDENGEVPVIVTNRHVLNENEHEHVGFDVHLDGDDIKSLEVRHIEMDASWLFHPTEDLAICFAAALYEGVMKQFGKQLFCAPLTEELVATSETLDTLTALEEVTMVGYPQGISDEVHGLPIFRKGYTASHPAFDFNGEPKGLMDIAGYWGSSGSPVFVYNDNGYTDRSGTTRIGAKRLIFLGIQCAIPVYDAEGRIVSKAIPTDNVLMPVPITKQPMNLAYYIKSETLLWFKEPISAILRAQDLRAR